MMGQYDLRTSFTPDLGGLHIKIYQFRELLRDSLPEVSAHLEDLQIDPASYVSQWFLSFFAVTCPLPVSFATGVPSLLLMKLAAAVTICFPIQEQGQGTVLTSADSCYSESTM